MPDEKHAQSGARLRTRTSIAFAALALLLSVSLAVMTYELTRGYLISKRENLATREALANAHSVTTLLRDPTVDRATVLPNLSSVGGFSPVLQLNGQWFASTIDVGRHDIPAGLRSLRGRQTARQWVTIDGAPAIVVAVPIQPNLGVYYQVFFLTELGSTLRTLALVLAIAAALTTLLGALLGLLACRRVLRPIDRMAQAAVSIAGGSRETRLTVNDPDLAPFVSSFNEMVDALQDRVDREARFAADASHELRTPLTAIRAAIDVLDRRVDDQARPALEILRRQTMRFENLVLDLLEISRSDPGSNALVLDVVDAVQLVEVVLRRTAHTEIPIEVDPSAPASAPLDCRRIERVLTNLIDNADHHGGGATRIVVDGTPGTLKIAVDAGPGVALSERELVFERFHRTDVSRTSTAPGTGLGLAIAAEHCRLHGGRLTVEDSPDGGARFLIELPLEAT